VRLALFGGTFDPVHNAHVAVAREAISRCALDRVLLIPNAIPPHKQRRLGASYEHRLRMVELAVEGNDGLHASNLEKDNETSYSILTIERLRSSLPAGTELYFIIGADAFSEIETWFRWQDVLREVEFLVLSRPGFVYDVPEGARVRRLDTLQLSVSSTEIRRRLSAGETPPELPEAVLRYIREHGLYQGQM